MKIWCLKIFPLIIFCLLSSWGVSCAQVLKIGAARWPPYEDITNFKCPGFSAEVVRHVLAAMNTPSKIKEYPWIRALNYVYNGKNDALFSAFFSEERADKCHFPEEPLAVAKYVMFIRREDSGKLNFNSFEDLKNKHIGIVRAAAYPGDFMKFIRANSIVEEVSLEDQNFHKLVMGRVDYIVADLGNGAVLARKMGIKDKIMPLMSRSVKEDYVYIIFSKKTVGVDFVKRFSDTLKSFKKSEEFHEIYNKYFFSDKLLPGGDDCYTQPGADSIFK